MTCLFDNIKFSDVFLTKHNNKLVFWHKTGDKYCFIREDFHDKLWYDSTGKLVLGCVKDGETVDDMDIVSKFKPDEKELDKLADKEYPPKTYYDNDFFGNFSEITDYRDPEKRAFKNGYKKALNLWNIYQ